MYKIRVAKPEDANQIAHVHIETWQSAYRGQIPDTYLDSLNIRERTLKWEQILATQDKYSQNYVAIMEDQILGFCTVGQCRDEDKPSTTGELWGIYVKPESMNKGIGSALINRAIEHLKLLNYTDATLWVLTSNTRTRKWYESKGWILEGQTKIDHRQTFDLHQVRYEIKF